MFAQIVNIGDLARNVSRCIRQRVARRNNYNRDVESSKKLINTAVVFVSCSVALLIRV